MAHHQLCGIDLSASLEQLEQKAPLGPNGSVRESSSASANRCLISRSAGCNPSRRDSARIRTVMYAARRELFPFLRGGLFRILAAVTSPSLRLDLTECPL
jgi:hypothetical protein